MKKWIVYMALAVCGCGANNIVGTWTGSVPGWNVTVNVDTQEESGTTGDVLGVISTDNAACFTNGLMTGSIAKTTVNLASSGSGSTSSATIITIQGEFDGDKITGYFTAVSADSGSGCSQDRIPMTLTRQ